MGKPQREGILFTLTISFVVHKNPPPMRGGLDPPALPTTNKFVFVCVLSLTSFLSFRIWHIKVNGESECARMVGRLALPTIPIHWHLPLARILKEIEDQPKYNK